MDTQPNFVTATELKAIGYAIEAYDIEVKTEGQTNIYWRYRITAPDRKAPGGKTIGEGFTTAAEAWDWARWHFGKATEKGARQ